MKLKTACNRDCPDACGIVATVEEGRVTRIEGDPDHPVTGGFLCYRTNRFLERQYDPERLTSPMIRRGDGFEPIGWDEALGLVVDKMIRIRDESGPAAILHYRSGGAMGLMKHVTDHFFERFGPVTIKSGDICSGAGEAAQEADFGVSDSSDLFDLRHSRTIVLWGKNPFVSSIHLVPLLKQVREAGARIVQIDPVYHRGAEIADLWLQPRPGGDLALGLGLARALFERGKTDPGLDAYCDNVDVFREIAFARDIAGWVEAAGVAREGFERLIEMYADGPSAILVGWGLQRRSRGGATVRVLDALAAVSGNLGVAGGGVSFYFKRRGAFDTSFVRGLDAAPRAIPEPLLGPGILEARDPRIRMVWITAGNPVAMLPESATVARALASRELTVVVDAFLTDTAHHAHLVLPTTTMLEDDDLLGAYGHHWLVEMRRVVDPPAGVRTDYDIVRQLAGRLGMNGELRQDADAWKRRLLGRVAERGASLEELRAGPVRNPDAVPVLFADRRFPTPSGRVNLIDELPDPDPPRPDPERPLFLMALSTDRAQSSQWPSESQRGPADVTVHPDAARGLEQGQVVRVESASGSIEARLRFDERQRREVALMDKGGWYRRGRSANALVRAQTTDLGGGARYYETPVRLRPPGE